MSKYSKDELICIFKSKFPNYQYSEFQYSNNKQKIEIICDKNHKFNMSVSQHLKGYNCPFCKGHKKTKSDILSEIIEIHNNEYEYPNFDFIKLEEKIEIVCKIHGSFKQSLKLHRNGSKCPKCSNRYNLSNDEFVKKCKEIDPNLNYSQVKYINNKTKVNIICPKHGLISRYPSSIKKYVCFDCYITDKSFNNFVEKASKKHKNRFNYYDYVSSKTKMKIEDKDSGFIFYQTPSYHLTCDYFYNKRTVDDFIKKSNEIHNNVYDYTESVYLGNKDRIKIKCKKHGIFEQVVNNHLRGAGCPKCNRFNKKESSIFNFIRENYDGDIIQSNRNILNGKEIDIYLPQLKLAFEFNGLYWHSDIYKDRMYHVNKTKKCRDNGVNLINIWEDDWNHKQDIMKSIILNKLGKSKKIFARKCSIHIVENKESREFLIKNHIQGFIGSKIKIGLYYQNELVSIMTFGGLRKSLGQKNKNESYELLRFCNKLGYSVVGGAGKLLKYFLNNYKAEEIISYSDNSRGYGNLYSKLGFDFVSETPPNYYWIVNGIRYHRFNFRKDKLVKLGYDENKTEVEIMKQNGHSRIFDCGSKKWSLNVKKYQ